EFEVEKFSFLIADGHASYGNKFLNRGFEVFNGYSEDELIEEFVEDCIFFLKHPDINKPSLFSPKSWILYFLDRLGWQRSLEQYKKDLAKNKST
ncbi:hypothetical protein GWN91_06320, partial [Candidatus Saccharibacteria bacterium]|nr:hypothetical protein [Candidatus Saccharibacteria bacterium]NIW80171.1 hypothetical protein [Calditrichia bacterium]